jgi:hypothetical protein
MRTLTKLAVASSLALGAFGLAANPARADFSTERPGSIMIFPKVINVAGRDTLIRVANTSNMPRTAHCYYVNGAPENPNLIPDPEDNPPVCQITDFVLNLSRQQPTQWLASEGRNVDPTDNGAPVDGGEGLDPGSIPPVPEGFTGQLLCAEVTESGEPVASNPFKGEATIGNTGESVDTSTDIGKYSAVTIEGEDPNGDLDLELDNAEYSACPEGLRMNFQSEASSDAVIDDLGGGGSIVNSNLTLVPCSVDFENAIGSTVTVNFQVRNEFEEPSSSSTTINCWGSIPLDFQASNSSFTLATPYGTASITPTSGGVVGVLSTRRIDVTTGESSSTDANLHFIGNNPSDNDGSVIRLREF